MKFNKRLFTKKSLNSKESAQINILMLHATLRFLTQNKSSSIRKFQKSLKPNKNLTYS
jgi:hypothetical protein